MAGDYRHHAEKIYFIVFGWCQDDTVRMSGLFCRFIFNDMNGSDWAMFFFVSNINFIIFR